MRFSPFISKLTSSLVLGGAALAMSGSALAQEQNGAVDGNIGLQRPVTPVMESIVSFNNLWLVPIMVGITLLVLVLMAFIMFRFRAKANPEPSKTSHNTLLEVVWTLVPVLILMVMAVPSINLLYFQDKIPQSELTVKVVGNTWNWEYSYPDHENVDTIISNIVDIPMPEKQNADGKGLSHAEIVSIIDARPADQPRLDGRPYLLATDNPLVVPVDTTVAVQVTSNNNIHSFAVPQFGVKIDAIPGKINETWFHVNAGEEGRYYGQCSEICGVNHAFMPIEIQVVSKAEFQRWLANDGSFTAQFSENTLGGGTTAANE